MTFPTEPLSRLRLSIVLLFLAVLAPALYRLWCVKGLWRTIRIDGGSMAETLYGGHFRVTCGNCGIPFRCDADAFPNDRRVVCPNCDFRDNELRDEELRLGDRVWVDTWPHLWSAPKRGDMVMLVEPKSNKTTDVVSFAVKRVAGLPGERPGIRHGDLLTDGKVIRKTMGELREVSLLVHDNDFLPGNPPIQRWLPPAPVTSDWQAIRGGFRFLPTADREEAQWLSYEHSGASAASPSQSAIVQDNDSYNQAEGPGLNAVRDLLFRGQIQADSGDFMLTLQDPPHKITVHLQLDSRRFLVLKNGSTLIAENLPQVAREFALEAAFCDGQFLFAHNRRVLAAFQYDDMPVAANRRVSPDDKSPLRFGAYGGPLEISHIQVRRDIFHLTPNRLGGDWQADAPLADGHYFLLGDNSSISVDSRHWPGGGVPRASILGKVVPIRR